MRRKWNKWIGGTADHLRYHTQLHSLTLIDPADIEIWPPTNSLPFGGSYFNVMFQLKYCLLPTFYQLGGGPYFNVRWIHVGIHAVINILADCSKAQSIFPFAFISGRYCRMRPHASSAYSELFFLTALIYSFTTSSRDSNDITLWNFLQWRVWCHPIRNLMGPSCQLFDKTCINFSIFVLPFFRQWLSNFARAKRTTSWIKKKGW